MPEDYRRIGESKSGRPNPGVPRRPVGGWSVHEVDDFVDSCDRLVRHLFDAGLRLHIFRTRTTDTSPDVAGELDNVLDDLDTLIRDSGMAMLALTRVRRDDGGGR
ncbi:hypothetical protein [Nocardia sp. BMG51109]|uniref:hypothetical protein n=1 Tax=Nocardia sp. BMG51109 TaxID=1056816 RepID=UPI0004645DEF|nr:hypothetical protein [Nocardia sp. BMG51109]